MVCPILLYNSKIWGGYVKSDFNAGMFHKLKEHIYSFVNVILKLVIRLLLLHVELNLVD